MTLTATDNDNEEAKDTAKKEGRSVSFWCDELQDAAKREKSYRKLAGEVVSIYESEKSESLPYNILYSNTETLKSALYNSMPDPVVKRRFNEKDPVGKASSEVISRYLQFFMDSNDRDYSNFDEMMKSAVKEALVPGRGQTRFRFESEESHESVCGEEVPWDRIHFGYAKRWANMPWVAFEHFMSKEELEANFDEAWAKEIPLTVTDKEIEDGEKKQSPPKDIGNATLARIIEVWDKDEKEVLFFCPDYKEAVIKRVEDPYGLSGFYPIPKPLYFGQKISSLIPIPLYAYYEEQAKELNRITIRINHIIKALKVRGFYDSSLQGIEKVLTAGDNELLPAENVASMRDGQSLEKAIWLMPIEKLIVVLQQLYTQRELIKQTIQEITGIADIMRGASKASETLGAQQLKNQWGGLRLNELQKEVQRYVRDCLRIVAEIAFKTMKQETFANIVNLKIPTQAGQERARQQIQMAKQQFQMQLQAQPPQPDQPPPQPPTPPEDITIAAMAPVTWEAVMTLCKDNLLRNYKIDIETDSTIAANSQQDKQEVGEFLNAMGQFLNAIMPTVQSGMVPFEAVKAILMSISRKYKFGTEVEGSLEQMQAPKPPPEESQAADSGEALKVALQAAQQKAQIETQLAQQEAQARTQQLQQESALKQIESEAKIKEIQRKDQLATMTFQHKIRQLELKSETERVNAAANAESTELKLASQEHAAAQSAKQAELSTATKKEGAKKDASV